jgi:hypothetical protein
MVFYGFFAEAPSAPAQASVWAIRRQFDSPLKEFPPIRKRKFLGNSKYIPEPNQFNSGQDPPRKLEDATIEKTTTLDDFVSGAAHEVVVQAIAMRDAAAAHGAGVDASKTRTLTVRLEAVSDCTIEIFKTNVARHEGFAESFLSGPAASVGNTSTVISQIILVVKTLVALQPACNEWRLALMNLECAVKICEAVSKPIDLDANVANFSMLVLSAARLENDWVQRPGQPTCLSSLGLQGFCDKLFAQRAALTTRVIKEIKQVVEQNVAQGQNVADKVGEEICQQMPQEGRMFFQAAKDCKSLPEGPIEQLVGHKGLHDRVVFLTQADNFDLATMEQISTTSVEIAKKAIAFYTNDVLGFGRQLNLKAIEMEQFA